MKKRSKPKRLPETNRFGELSALAICLNWFNGYKTFPKGMGDTIRRNK